MEISGPLKPSNQNTPPSLGEKASEAKQLGFNAASKINKQKSAPPLAGRVTMQHVENDLVTFTSDISPAEAAAFIQRNSNTERKGPDLVRENDPRKDLIDKIYRVTITEEKKAYRKAIVEKLKAQWAVSLSPKKVEKLEKQFLFLATSLDRDGVSVLGDLVSKADFTKFIQKYDTLLNADGNQTWIHSFADLRAHPEFLYDSSFNKSYFHPLLLTLVAYQMGGPIRINDARAKDTGVLVVNTLDSMCHIDNTPFTKEVKLTLFWETHKPKGPVGQCFVCLPGTNKTPRAFDGLIEDGQIAYTTEAGSVFRTKEELLGAIKAQASIRGESPDPTIVAVRNGDKVYTAIAETGAMVHHRWRVENGAPRSCLLLSFHLIEDDPGVLIPKDRRDQMKQNVNGNKLSAFVLGEFSPSKERYLEEFLNAIDETVASETADLLKAFEGNNGSEAEVFSLETLALKPEEVEAWRTSVLEDPGTTAKKNEANIIKLEEKYSKEELIDKVCQLMAYDKTGVLELILYSDNREEKRKWARNQIRELKNTPYGYTSPEGTSPSLSERIKGWEEDIVNGLSSNNLMEKEDLARLGNKLSEIAKELERRGATPTQELLPKVGNTMVYPAVRQLIEDLAIAIANCSNPECFLSTSLFLFWSADTLIRVTQEGRLKEEARAIGSKFLRHYVALNVATEIKREHEKASPEDFDAPLD